jgi:hypothetical protein
MAAKLPVARRAKSPQPKKDGAGRWAAEVDMGL